MTFGPIDANCGTVGVHPPNRTSAPLGRSESRGSGRDVWRLPDVLDTLLLRCDGATIYSHAVAATFSNSPRPQNSSIYCRRRMRR